MRWSWVRRSEHERIVAELRTQVEISEHVFHKTSEALADAHMEVTRLQQVVLTERNAHAVTRGLLIAEAHARGEPAPSLPGVSA